jgi:hypothetical protein
LIPIVPERLFRQAQAILEERKGTALSDRHMLQLLRRILKRDGFLTTAGLQRTKGAPNPATFKAHFGSLKRAFELAGYAPPQGRARRANGEPWSDEMLLEGLQRLHAEHGILLSEMIWAATTTVSVERQL